MASRAGADPVSTEETQMPTKFIAFEVSRQMLIELRPSSP